MCIYSFEDKRLIEPFFVINGFWKLLDSETRDHYRRTSVGLQRSSPKYYNQHLRQASDCYFKGTFDVPQYQKMLIDIEKKTRGRLNLNDVSKSVLKNGNDAYYAKSFFSCLNAYIHSPIQTKKQRKEFEDENVQKAFENLMKRAEVHFFVQKVDFEELGRWPQISLVSSSYFSIFFLLFLIIN